MNRYELGSSRMNPRFESSRMDLIRNNHVYTTGRHIWIQFVLIHDKNEFVLIHDKNEFATIMFTQHDVTYESSSY